MENYVATAVEQMKLITPYVVEIGAIGLNGVYMGAPNPEAPSGVFYGPIRDGSLVRRYEFQDVARGTLHGVLRQYFNELYDLAELSRADTLTDDHVRKNDLPERS